MQNSFFCELHASSVLAAWYRVKVYIGLVVDSVGDFADESA